MNEHKWEVTVIDHGGDEESIGVYVDGKEIGRYCVVDDPERERDHLERMIQACCDAEMTKQCKA